MSIVFNKITKKFPKYTKEKSLVKRFKNYLNPKKDYKYILKDVSFEIEKGEFVGYLGKNGAGKSTTIKILSGILRPDSGFCNINNMIPWKNRKEYVKDIGVVFGQKTNLWWDLPVLDSYKLLKSIYKIPEEKFNTRLKFLSQELDILPLLSSPVRSLSLGQRMRCEILAALLHKPSILFLDEPTIGLDALSKKKVRGFISKINKQEEITVILTTHDTQDLESLVNRILFLDKGTIAFDGSLDDFKKFGGRPGESLEEILLNLY